MSWHLPIGVSRFPTICERPVSSVMLHPKVPFCLICRKRLYFRPTSFFTSCLARSFHHDGLACQLTVEPLPASSANAMDDGLKIYRSHLWSIAWSFREGASLQRGTKAPRNTRNIPWSSKRRLIQGKIPSTKLYSQDRRSDIPYHDNSKYMDVILINDRNLPAWEGVRN